MRGIPTGMRLLAFAALVIYVLTCREPLSAQQAVAIRGNHVSNIALTTELADAQTISGEVVMALNNRAELNQLAVDLQNRDSPHYHQWLTPEEFAQRFGPTPQQMQAVANWLTAAGVTVTAVDPVYRAVRFTGSYAQVKVAMAVRIVTDGQNYANVNDPQVPAYLAPTIVSIEGLVSQKTNPVMSHADSIVSSCMSKSGGSCGDSPHFGPGDLYTFYDENAVLTGGNYGTGGGDCVALPEGGSINTAALSTFTSQFATALPSPAVMPAIDYQVAPTSGATPGLPGDSEPYLDIEWVHAVSPNTPIRVYYTNGPNNYLGSIQQAVNENLCGAISSSTEGGCQALSTILALDDVELQGTIQGQTIFKSSGDYGADWYCGRIFPTATAVPSGYPTPGGHNQQNCTNSNGNPYNSYTDANGDTYQPSVDEEATSPNITAVGGTRFVASYAPTSTSSPVTGGMDLSTASPGLETVWNQGQSPAPTPMATSGFDSCPVKDVSGGGPSQVFPKPSWQASLTASDGVRDIPDVAMGADAANPGYFIAKQDYGDPSVSFTLTGGTSIATPMWAGVSRLIAQAEGVTRLGNINARLYELGSLEETASGPYSSALGLVDVVKGNNNDAGIEGYTAGPGYDMVTGWGSPDIAKLVAAFPGAAASPSPVDTTVSSGSTAAAGSFTLTNTTGAALSVMSVTVNLSNPGIFTALTLTATVGSASPQTAAATSDAASVFTFSPPLVLQSMATATFSLSGLTGGGTVAGITGGSGMDGSSSSGGHLIVGAGSLLLVFGLALMAPRRRIACGLGGVILLCGLAIAASNCGSSGASGTPTTAVTPSPTAAPTATAKPTAQPTTTAMPTASSRQTIPQGAISISDGQGGIVEASGLPGSLGTVTVRY